ncbi:MAG: (Fe-S)-binding protein [Desulfurivibrionaceae bacterium]
MPLLRREKRYAAHLFYRGIFQRRADPWQCRACIAINCVKNPTEAREILAWLQREINTAWKNRGEITPKYSAAPWPKPADILSLLPKTDCGQCGLSTCIAFASMVAEGGKDAEDCPALPPIARKELATYLSRFHFDGQ